MYSFFVSLINNTYMQKAICLCANRCVVCTTECTEIKLSLQNHSHDTHTHTNTSTHLLILYSQTFMQSSSHTLNLPFSTVSSCPPLNKHSRPTHCVSHLISPLVQHSSPHWRPSVSPAAHPALGPWRKWLSTSHQTSRITIKTVSDELVWVCVCGKRVCGNCTAGWF